MHASIDNIWQIHKRICQTVTWLWNESSSCVNLCIIIQRLGFMFQLEIISFLSSEFWRSMYKNKCQSLVLCKGIVKIEFDFYFLLQGNVGKRNSTSRCAYHTYITRKLRCRLFNFESISELVRHGVHINACIFGSPTTKLYSRQDLLLAKSCGA